MLMLMLMCRCCHRRYADICHVAPNVCSKDGHLQRLMLPPYALRCNGFPKVWRHTVTLLSDRRVCWCDKPSVAAVSSPVVDTCLCHCNNVLAQKVLHCSCSSWPTLTSIAPHSRLGSRHPLKSSSLSSVCPDSWLTSKQPMSLAIVLCCVVSISAGAGPVQLPAPPGHGSHLNGLCHCVSFHVPNCRCWAGSAAFNTWT
jgi:hypothetical protein